MHPKSILLIISILALGITSHGQVTNGNDIDGESAGDLSGYSTAILSDGSIVAIGAVFNGGNGNSAGHWVQAGNDVDGEAAGDQAGFSISLSSNASTVAIGAIQNDDNGLLSGHVRMYDLLPPISVNELNSKATINFHPNPSNSFITIKMDEGQLKEVEVYNLTGSLVYKTDLNSNQYSLNSVNYAIGTYILKIVDQNFNVTAIKFIKE